MVKGHQQQQQRRVHHGATTLQIKSGFAHLITVCAAISLPEKGIRLRWRNKGRQGVRGAQEREEKIPRVGVAQKHKVFSMYEVHGLFRTVSERQQNNNARRWQETRELQQR